MSDPPPTTTHSGSARKSLVRPNWPPIRHTAFESGKRPQITQPSSSSHTSPALKSPTGSLISSSSTGSVQAHSSVQQFLHTLGLSEYLQRFLNEGFDRLQSIEAITEDDLEYMSVKRGHRRILQRALATRGQLPDCPHVPVQGSFDDRSLTTMPVTRPYTPPESTTDASSGLTNHKPSVPIESLLSSQKQNVPLPRGCSPTLPNQFQTDEQSSWVRTEISLSQSLPASSAASNGVSQPTNGKRKYQRHPKPDHNAPEKPLSAYVMFSNQIREELKGQQISFTEIARLVGDRWKNLSPDSKELIVKQAAEAKIQWSTEMEEYKKTPEYLIYQKYVKEFKATNGNSKPIKSQASTSRRSGRAGHVRWMTEKPERRLELSGEHRLESEEEEEDECSCESEGGGSETRDSKRPRTSSSSCDADWKVGGYHEQLNHNPPTFSSYPHPHTLTFPNTLLNPISHKNRDLNTSQTGPARHSLLITSATNNTFFEKSSIRLPTDLRLDQITTLSTLREKREVCEKIHQ